MGHRPGEDRSGSRPPAVARGVARDPSVLTHFPREVFFVFFFAFATFDVSVACFSFFFAAILNLPSRTTLHRASGYLIRVPVTQTYMRDSAPFLSMRVAPKQRDSGSGADPGLT